MSGDTLEELLGGQEQPAGSIKIGGRLFSFVTYQAITSLNEHYVMKIMRDTGLDKVLPRGDEEPDVEYLVRLQSAIIDTLKVHELLAGYMLPAGSSESDWSIAMARSTTRFLQQLQEPEDKAEIQRLALAMVFDFFKNGLASYNASLNSLESSGRESPQSEQKIGAH